MPSKLYTVNLAGCTAPSGERYCIINDHGTEYLIARDSLISDRAHALRLLTEQGLLIPGTGYVAQLLESVRAIHIWPEREVLVRPGWSGPIFALPNGQMLVPSVALGTAPDPGAGYLRHPHRYFCSGSLKVLKRRVFQPLARDALATFLIGLPFAPVIRSLVPRSIAPFTVQIVDEKRSSALRRLCLSVTGSMTADALAADPIEKLIADPTRYIANSRDNLLVIGNLANYLNGASNKKRRDSVRSLLFDHLLSSDGADTNATGASAPCCVIIEAQPIEGLLELGSE